MNLLTDGINNRSVIKTTLNKQLRIDGHTDIYEVYEIKLDALYYNDQNDRIATWISKYKADNKVAYFDMSDVKSYNNIIEGFIVESNPDAMRTTKNNIKLIGQQEYGVVLNDGRIIDGNRRFTCLRQIEKETGQTQYFKAVILPHDFVNDAKQIKMLELALQLGVDRPVDYDPIDRLVGLYRDVVETGLLTAREYADNVDKTEREIKKDIERAKLMIEFLDYIKAPKQYHIVKELKLSEPLVELQKILNKFSGNAVLVNKIKYIIFSYFLILNEGDKKLYIRKIAKILNDPVSVDDYVDEQIQTTEKIMDVLDKHEEIDEKVINNECRTDEIVGEFTRSTEVWSARTDSRTARNRSAQLLDKAYDTIDEIDTNIFSKLSADQINEVLEKIDKLQKIIDDLRGELDV